MTREHHLIGIFKSRLSYKTDEEKAQFRSACVAIGISLKVRLANKSEPNVLINLNLLMLSEKASSITLKQDLSA